MKDSRISGKSVRFVKFESDGPNYVEIHRSPTKDVPASSLFISEYDHLNGDRRHRGHDQITIRDRFNAFLHNNVISRRMFRR